MMFNPLKCGNPQGKMLPGIAFGLEFRNRCATIGTMKRIPHPSRRRFLQSAAAATASIGFPTIVPSSVFGQNAPSNRITMGVVGWGMQGPGNTNAFLAEPDCQVVAACDLDKKHLDAAAEQDQRALQEHRLQGLPRLPRTDGAQGHRRRHARRAGQLARAGLHRGR